MRSDSVKTGTQQAPHRSLLNALGYTEEERRRPMTWYNFVIRTNDTNHRSSSFFLCIS